MADLVTDGFTRVYSVPSISNIAAPTTTELNAGTRLDTLLTPDGLMGFNPETAAVDTSALSSTFNTAQPGRVSFSGMALQLKKQSQAADAVYNTMIYNYATNIVVRRGVDAGTAWTTAQAIEVYPVVCGQVSNQNPEANTVQRYQVPMLPSTSPSLRAAVA